MAFTRFNGQRLAERHTAQRFTGQLTDGIGLI